MTNIRIIVTDGNVSKYVRRILSGAYGTLSQLKFDCSFTESEMVFNHLNDSEYKYLKSVPYTQIDIREMWAHSVLPWVSLHGHNRWLTPRELWLVFARWGSPLERQEANRLLEQVPFSILEYERR